MLLESINPDIRSILAQLEEKEIDLDPEFQRGDVWNIKKQQMLIDTIIRRWEIPPIFLIINEERNIREVLDGHQRLRAIESFYTDKFKFSGDFQPFDDNLKNLDGLYFSEFPEIIKKSFRNFPLRTFLISNYSESEPFELFYRLNQNAPLTSAERRNTLYGPARETTKKIVSFMIENNFNINTIGFNNTRLGYHDVIARVLISIEKRDISKKILDSVITDRYRLESNFDPQDVCDLENALKILIETIRITGKVKFNKPTLYSFLVFMLTSLENFNTSDIEKIITEYQKIILLKNQPNIDLDILQQVIFGEFALRVSTGVNDAKAVIFRNFFFNWLANNLEIPSLKKEVTLKVEYTKENLLNSVCHKNNNIEISNIIIENEWGVL
ncbi:DUF262 domain-containing protein [Grimontia sp. SpTr1]|uniref:DUF262 domain-containing protein n=1 Tax=Grimontia sp. SpTr1 TaxID=2995319 RepID=UPI00248BC5A6|nr:DUF262 domain-containing protein [Grimontia sp. SpTr1]